LITQIYSADRTTSLSGEGKMTKVYSGQWAEKSGSIRSRILGMNQDKTQRLAGFERTV
jgi:hypothetical protein